ncbi:unnamed protein product [Prorocentrum cordatum]|uniref:Uncharacterized protein n=1 Tax=Prorocentrum cordatum TaxID=2364126 RepID=A0ABN9XAA9_9DINO|nr:unnamed protein product [Polarella glacialis]
MQKWVKLGKVELKVVPGHTKQGTQYLNFYVKHLGRTGFAVGGLLGEDDHKEASMPTEACLHQVSLLEHHETSQTNEGTSRVDLIKKFLHIKHGGASDLSVAEASLA